MNRDMRDDAIDCTLWTGTIGLQTLSQRGEQTQQLPDQDVNRRAM